MPFVTLGDVMERDERKRLELGGAIVHLASGEDGVHVSLQIRERLPLSGRQELRKLLNQRFELIAKELSVAGGELDLGTISDLAQSVEASLPISRYEGLVRKLTSQDIRVDPLVRRQVLQVG